jgi:hypothetical protein
MALVIQLKTPQAAVAQTQTQAPSQSQITLADNNPRRKKPGILLATQDKNIVKRKHALENELKMYQKLLNTFFVCSSVACFTI